MRAPSHHLTVAEASRLIRARKLSPVEYVDLLAQRITEIDPQIHAFIAPTIDHARRQAVVAEQEIMAGQYRGPMHGIPFGAKDIFETAGIATTGGSRTARNHVPQRDAAIVTRLNAAGALLLGKLATHEFAHGGPSFDLPWPPVRNPWALERFAGGSSSGSGAAVAAGLVPCALGSDTGGSIRGPASFCGIAGFMPSSGLVSRAGVMPNSYSLDHCGPMAWTVEDCAIMLQAIAGYDPADGNSVEQAIPDFHGGLGGGIRGLRVGVLRSVWEDELPAPPEHRAALEQAVETMRQLGAIVEDCQVAPMQDYMDVKVVIAETEIFSVHQLGLAERAGEYGHDFLTRILPAVMFQSVDYLAAQRHQRRLIDQMRPLYGRYDLFLAQGFGPAPMLAAHQPITFWKKPNVQVMANITGGPALAVCCGFTSAGLPLGMQLIGKPGADALVLVAGDAYERATQWRDRRPALSAGAHAPEIDPPQIVPDTAECDEDTRELAERLARNAGLDLTDAQLAILFEAAPHARAMARRLRRDRSWFEEPANVFRLT